jgi:hypothetical protein
MKPAALLIFLCATAAMAADVTTRPDISVQEQPTTRRSNFNYGGNGGYRNNAGNGEYGNRRFGRRFGRDQNNQPEENSTNLPAITEEVGSRNIFIRGNQRSLPPQPAPPQTPLSDHYIATANDLVLTGVSLSDYGRVAFLEDQGANSVTQVVVGQSIAAGKITKITLDSLDYQDASGRTIRVNVGFNLAGGDVWGVSASQSAGSTSSSSTQPSRTGPRAPNESMEDYLKRRRAEEMGH